MKKGIILCVSLIVAAVIGITAWLLVPQKAQPAKGDMARVDGVFITGEQMHNAMEFNQIQMDTYERLFYKTYALEEDAKAQLAAMAVHYPTDSDDVVHYLIRAQILWEYLKGQGKEVSKEEAAQTYDTELSI